MKIIRLTTFLDFGGIESKMANLATYSDENEWIFCSIGKGGFAANKIAQNKKEVVCFNADHGIPSFKTIMKLYFYFKKQNPQVVHTAGSEANFHGVIAAKLAKVPVIIAEEIGIPSHSKIAKFIFNFIYKLADFVIGESQSVIDNLKNNYTINEDKLTVISNFTLFESSENKSFTIINNEFRIVSVSRLEPVKNIEGIIRVVQKLKQDNIKIKYTIVGEGSSKKALQNLVQELDLEKEIEFVGFKDNPRNCYLNSDLYILNSFSEGFSNSLLEAMYLKTPSITTAVGGASELIKDGINGWIVTSNYENGLDQKIRICIGLDSAERIKIGDNAHKTVVEKFSLQNHINALMQLYNSKK